MTIVKLYQSFIHNDTNDNTQNSVNIRILSWRTLNDYLKQQMWKIIREPMLQNIRSIS